MKRMAILTCVACQQKLCSYCIQLSDHECQKIDEKISKDREMFQTKLFKNALPEEKLQRI